MTRLTTRMRVDALIRQVAGAGGFATVLRHGDDSAGNLVLVIARRDGSQTALQRLLGSSGYNWTPAVEQPPGQSGLIEPWVSRQAGYDPDLWVVELDIADAERFVADFTRDD